MADVSNIRSHNQNYKYLLFVIDVFSRYLWIQPITDKTSKSVINALKIVLRSRKLNSIKSDKGSESKNKEVRSFLKKEDIHTFYSQDETKHALFERFIRTIKTALYRYFRHKQI
jgi:transposase InsO family protein